MKTYLGYPGQRYLVAEPIVPLVQLHGLWGSAAQFDYWSGRFDRETLAVDLIGHGCRAGQCLDGKSIFDYATDAYTEISRKFAGQQFDLIGHSAGGLIAQLLASRYPDQVRSLTLIASAFPKESGARLPIIWESFRPNIIRAVATHKAFSLTPKQERYCALGARVCFWKESGLALREVMRSTVSVPAATIKCPVTVIAATDDQFTPVKLQARLADYYGVNLVRVRGTHMCHVHPESRDQVIAAVKQHLPMVARRDCFAA